MSIRSTMRRTAMLGAATGAAMALGVASAGAHDCFVPMYSLNGPSSANWDVYSAERGAAEIAGFVPACDEAAAAGYAALRAEGLPVGIKISNKHVIGDPKGDGNSNPNGANGKGMEYFSDGSTLAFDMLGTWIGAAATYDCG
jgi:hypothetical protein